MTECMRPASNRMLTLIFIRTLGERQKMSNAKRKWHCPHCSQDSSRHWNVRVHIKRWHIGIGEPINEEKAKEFKDKGS